MTSFEVPIVRGGQNFPRQRRVATNSYANTFEKIKIKMKKEKD